MTEQEINDLKAGWKTDYIVAEHLFSWHKFQTSNTKFDAFMRPCCDVCGRTEKPYYVEGFPQIRPIFHLEVLHPPAYSSLRYAAYRIVDLMLEEGWSLSELSSANGTSWSVIWEKLPRSNEFAIVATAETDCLAICKAGLKWKFRINF